MSLTVIVKPLSSPPQGHISSLKELLSPAYSYLWVRPSVSSQQVAALTTEAQHIASLVLKYVVFITRVLRHAFSLQGCGDSRVFARCRLMAERDGELAVDGLGKDLKTLAKQARDTKYGDVMKLLRLALSGLQVRLGGGGGGDDPGISFPPFTHQKTALKGAFICEDYRIEHNI